MTSRSPIKTSPRERGFGLIGLIVAILLLSLGTVMVVSMMQSSKSTVAARITLERANNLREALVRYRNSHGGTSGTYPATLAGLVTDDSVACTAPVASPTPATYPYLQGWCGPYIDRLFAEESNAYKTDGWGTAFSFVQGTGVLTSCGPDLTCGNGDDLVYNP